MVLESDPSVSYPNDQAAGYSILHDLGWLLLSFDYLLSVIAMLS